ncbi:MAG TPA: LysR substrate-binding domain-containing protein [Acidimicrobiia bacterium]|nr:LysR substrate-binding domain-containing protein [Acidimicrobiia bacterium]
MITVTQLRTFVEVAEAGSVRVAAERLIVSQPAVSAVLAALHRELGVPLAVREGRGLRVTPAGMVFAGYARRILGLLDEARVATAGQLHPDRGRVRLAAVTTVGEHVLPAFLASFRDRYPDAEVTLEVGNRTRVWSLLEHREVDLAIGGRPPTGGRFVTLATRPNVLVVVAEADAAGGGKHRAKAVPVEELGRQVWLVREPGSGTRASTEELLARLGIAPSMLTVGSNGAVRESVRVGLGVTLISRDAVRRELEDGTLREWRCPGLPLERAWHAVGGAGEQLPPTAGLFLAHLAAPGRGSADRLWRTVPRPDPPVG